MSLAEKVSKGEFLLGDEVENLVSVVYHLDGVLHKNLEVSRKLQ